MNNCSVWKKLNLSHWQKVCTSICTQWKNLYFKLYRNILYAALEAKYIVSLKELFFLVLTIPFSKIVYHAYAK